MTIRPDVIVERALELSKADECIAIAWRSSTANVRWANNTSTTNGTGDAIGLYLISIVGGAVGAIRRDAFSEETLPEIVRASEAACDGRPRANDYMPLLEGDDAPADWADEAPRTEVGALAPVTPALVELFERARAASVLTYGYAELGTTTTWLGASTGLRRRHTHVAGKIEFTSKSDDLERSTWNGRVLTSFDQLDMHAMWERTRQRLEWQAMRSRIDAGRYEVLLDPSCVADMVMYMSHSMARREADEGRTVFSKTGGNRLGEALFADRVSLYSDPAEPGLETTPFVLAGTSGASQSVFDNGLSLARTDWITRGTLANLVTPRYWAKRSGGPVVPDQGNLVMDGGDAGSIDDMIARTDRALLLNCLWYIREVDPQTLLLTGLTRDGVYLVEGGEVVGAVNNFRFNVSPVSMLANAAELGTSEPTLPREFEWGLTRMPPMRVSNWHMSSVSDAT